MTFINVIVPVVVVAGVGFFYGRWTKADAAPLTKLSFYVLTPALIFHSFATHAISVGDLGRTALFASIIHLSLFLIAILGVRWTVSYESGPETEPASTPVIAR